MTTRTRSAVVNSQVIAEHAADVAFLWHLRTSVAVRGPHYRLVHLAKLDNRIAAHLDGLSVAGTQAAALYQEAVDGDHPGALFAPTLKAIEVRDLPALDQAIEEAQESPNLLKGLLSALGWCEPSLLQGLVASLLASDDPFRKFVATSACSLHRVDPGLKSGALLQDPDARTRARALRAAGEVGVGEPGQVLAAITDEDSECQFWAAWSSTLRGDYKRSLELLKRLAIQSGPRRARALALVLQRLPAAAGHALLKEMAADPDQSRWVIQGTGVVGDPSYIPWLIDRMKVDATARVAGEAFTFMTGCDLALLDLERTPPDETDAGPNDDPEDQNVEMDPDDSLPWPDPDRIQAWWRSNSQRFDSGRRYFMGAPVTREHCLDVLATGYQRQRILAAHYLCLLAPGTPLFNTDAPSWRQQGLLTRA